MKKYMDVLELLEYILNPNSKKAKDLRHTFLSDFPDAPGSSHNHQAWPGGYYGHIIEVLNYAKLLYDAMHEVRELPFSLGDALLVLFLHDLEKPYTYADHIYEPYKDLSKYALRDRVIQDWGFELSDDHRNALLYVHGEGDDYTNTKRVSGPLAAFCHCIDTMSARIYFDFPKGKNR